MTDLTTYSGWMQNLVRVESLTDGPMSEGSRFREIRLMFGKEASEEFEVTTFEPSSRLGLHVDGTKGATGRGSFQFDYLLTPTPDGTEFRMTATIDMGGGFFTNLVSKLMGGMFKKAIVKDLDAMVHYIEFEHQPTVTVEAH